MNDNQKQALRDLYAHSRLEQPSRQLDERIRKAAKRAHYRQSKRWIWGLSTAAVIVLSFNVVLNLLLIEPDPVEIISEEKLPAPVQPKMHPLAQQETMMDSMEVMPQSAPAQLSAPAVEEQRSIQMKEKKANNTLLERAFSKPEAVRKRKPDQQLSSGMVAPDLSRLLLSIPTLPLQLDQLLQLNTSLTGEEKAIGLINLYSDNKLILRVDSRTGISILKAWPGAEILGVRVNWKIKSSQLDQCKADNVYISCRLDDRVLGLFEQDRLDHITWRASSD